MMWEDKNRNNLSNLIFEERQKCWWHSVVQCWSCSFSSFCMMLNGLPTGYVREQKKHVFWNDFSGRSGLQNMLIQLKKSIRENWRVILIEVWEMYNFSKRNTISEALSRYSFIIVTSTSLQPARFIFNFTWVTICCKIGYGSGKIHFNRFKEHVSYIYRIIESFQKLIFVLFTCCHLLGGNDALEL